MPAAVALERVDATEADALVAAWLALARPPLSSPTWFEPALLALEAAWAERPSLELPTLPVDLLLLASGERLGVTGWAPPGPVRSALRQYEDDVLARLLFDSRWGRFSEALAAAPARLRPSVAGLAASGLLERLRAEGTPSVNPAVLRRLLTRPPAEVLELGRSALQRPHLAQRVALGLTTVAKLARGTGELLSDAELLVAENVEALRSLAARVGLAQLATVSQDIESRLPTRLRSNIDSGDAPTTLEAESAFPVGGFASLSTRGSLENLVTSELVYLDTSADNRPDLFDIRFVEGELLYYARDEAVAVRRRSHVVLVLDASVATARVLDAGERAQRLVFVLGSMVALVRRLSQWLDTQTVRFEVCVTGPEGAALIDEGRLLELALREHRARGQVGFTSAVTAAEALARAHDAQGGRTRSIVFSRGWPEGLSHENGPDALVDVTSAQPSVLWRQASAFAGQRDALNAWSTLTTQLLDGLLRPSRQRVAGLVPRP